MDRFKQAFYDGAVLSALTVAYSVVGDKLLKTSVGDPSKPSLEKITKLLVAVSGAVVTKGILEEKKILPGRFQMAAAIGMAIFGAVLNATAFTGGNMLAQKLSGGGAASLQEKKRHDEAIEKFTAARAEFDQHRARVYDWLSARRNTVKDAEKELDMTDSDLLLYQREHGSAEIVEPYLTDFYRPSETQKNYELLYIAGGFGVAALVIKFGFM